MLQDSLEKDKVITKMVSEFFSWEHSKGYSLGYFQF